MAQGRKDSIVPSFTVAGVILLGLNLLANAEDVPVNVQWTSQPDRSLPAHIRSIEVQMPEYLHRASDDGIMRDLQVRWYRMLINELRNCFRDGGRPLNIIEREDRVAIHRLGKDRLYNGGDPDLPVHREVADAVIVVRFRLDWEVRDFCEEVKFHERAAKGIVKKALDLVPVVGGPASGAVDNPSRRARRGVWVSVGCDMVFTMPYRTQILSYDENLEDRDMTDPSTWGFGYDEKRLYELKSVQEMTSELIRRHASAFASRLVSLRQQAALIIEDADDVQLAVARLNGGDQQLAILEAWETWMESESDDAAAACVLGIAHQTIGNWREAHGWFFRAHTLERDCEQYASLMRTAEIHNTNRAPTAHYANGADGSGSTSSQTMGQMSSR